jgi:5-methyltetrahydropteroyltriglutamate--homocysteine methyltransferase
MDARTSKDASRYVDLGRLCISSQRRFSSSYLGNPLTIDNDRRKLARVVEVARSVWGAA